MAKLNSTWSAGRGPDVVIFGIVLSGRVFFGMIGGFGISTRSLTLASRFLRLTVSLGIDRSAFRLDLAKTSLQRFDQT